MVTNIWCEHLLKGEIVTHVPVGYVGFKQDVVLPEINWIVSHRMEGLFYLMINNFPFIQDFLIILR